MNPSLALNLLIPAVVICYAIYLVVRMIKNRKRGCSCGGCSGCPMAESCHMLHQKEQKKEPNQNEP
ncbi:MAG: FeoB-associated Cys-rich membrane protein [Clostridia bacterium]